MGPARSNRLVVCLALAAACFAGAHVASAQEKAAEDEAARQMRIARELIEVTQAYVVYKIGDFDAAFKAWMALAEKGNTQGMLNVGNMYLAGDGVEKDPEVAFGWYRKAAETGSSIGLHQVAEAYALGRGVEKDEAKARALYQQAAEKGSAEAQRWLGERLLREGNVVTGKEWLEKAAAQGDMRARDIRAAADADDPARAVVPAAEARVRALLGAIDASANARHAGAFTSAIAKDAEIEVGLPSPGGATALSRMTPQAYQMLWRETFARSADYAFTRSSVRLASSDDGVTADSVIDEAFGQGRPLRLRERLLIDLSGRTPLITGIRIEPAGE